MFNTIKQLFANKLYRLIALVLLILIAGPELMMVYELMALLEFLGPSTFVLIHLAGIKLYLLRLKNAFMNFEKHSLCNRPKASHIIAMPALIIHYLPERSIVLGFISSISICCVHMFMMA
ncbi:hypothetical protein CWC28_11245 [Pseudoalteromonas sp. S4492]|jgi:hypothetical protein|uniref:hypothetical protein n=1 Tax=Pseudoalteromonas sp. S4492 TaxID=579560 RepID=UPI00110B3A79|nr:hypothetical protein [Pseudoalteromonas sp. S4492]TMO27468.1 hypothetical protein CWC28_11245 [Pseudoalteromonas sp. S4492]